MRRGALVWLMAVGAITALPSLAAAQGADDFTSPFPPSPFAPAADPATTHTYGALQAAGGELPQKQDPAAAKDDGSLLPKGGGNDLLTWFGPSLFANPPPPPAAADATPRPAEDQDQKPAAEPQPDTSTGPKP